MSFSAVPEMDRSFEQPSSETLNVGAPTIFTTSSPDATRKPSSFTLDVGAPTFLTLTTCRGGFIPRSSLFVVADLQVGSFLATAMRPETGPKAGHYKAAPVVAR
jgi:hypothetical protein